MSVERNKTWLAGIVAALFFVIMTPWVLRPWFLSQDQLPRDTSFFATVENADLFLNTWILAWVARAAGTEPQAIFDGNIFYPAGNTIALSENMIGHIPVTGPIYALTHSALTVLKAMALESFLLAGLGMFALIFFHTRNTGAALIAGAAFAFAPWRVNGFPHPQYLATGTIPLAFLAIDLWLDRRRARHLVALALTVGLQILFCLYLGYFILFAVAAYGITRWLATTPRNLRTLLGMGAAAATGALVAAPIALPYLQARSAGSVQPFDPALFVGHAWAPWDYVSLAFVSLAGVAVIALVLLDLIERILRRIGGAPLGLTPQQRALWAVVGVAVVFSTGPYVQLGELSLPTPYLIFYDYLPGFSSIRGPRRFFIVVLAGLAGIAGYAFARWTHRAPTWLQSLAGLVVALLCAFAAAPRPTAVQNANLGANAAPVYEWLARQPRSGAVLEIPTSSIEGDFVGAERNARYMLASTTHWHPLVNGYSGYEPRTATFLTTAIRELPRPAALQFLVDTIDLQWIVVHRTALIGYEKARWDEIDIPGLEPAAEFGDTTVYAVTREPKHDWRPRLVATPTFEPGRSWGGASIAELSARCRSGRILDVRTPPVIALTAFPIRIDVEFENLSPCSWPAVALPEQDLVGLTYAWTNPAGETFARGPFSRLLSDVAPYETRTAPLMVIPPFGNQGRWRLAVFLEQAGAAAPITETSTVVEVRQMNP